MLQFFFFMLIILGFIAGSAFIYIAVTRLTGRVKPGGEEFQLSMVREELESLAVRLGRVEEEVDFYKRLKGPETPELPGSTPGSEGEES